jgi:hypothetical protein
LGFLPVLGFLVSGFNPAGWLLSASFSAPRESLFESWIPGIVISTGRNPRACLVVIQNFLPVYSRVRRVQSFQELVATPWAEGVNALCWERALPGDFREVVARLGDGEGVVALDEARLLALPVTAAGRAAIEFMLADLRVLRARELDPVLNLIHAYPRDEEAGAVATDVFSFHVDRAPIPTDTWLCTYHGAPSEGLANELAERKVDDPVTRAVLLEQFGGEDNAAFAEYLSENSYDLHYAARPGARPFSFGLGNLWRIAVEYPGCPVSPCVHRAPDAEGKRLLMIS